jgi:hypothetical protein
MAQANSTNSNLLEDCMWQRTPPAFLAECAVCNARYIANQGKPDISSEVVLSTVIKPALTMASNVQRPNIVDGQRDAMVFGDLCIGDVSVQSIDDGCPGTDADVQSIDTVMLPSGLLDPELRVGRVAR